MVGDIATHEVGSDYVSVATWSDAVEGNGTLAGFVVDDQVHGTCTLTFDYTDGNGNAAATVIRTVVVEDTINSGDHSYWRYQCNP